MLSMLFSYVGGSSGGCVCPFHLFYGAGVGIVCLIHKTLILHYFKYLPIEMVLRLLV